MKRHTAPLFLTLWLPLCITAAANGGMAGKSWAAAPRDGLCLAGGAHAHLAVSGTCSAAYEAGQFDAARQHWAPLATTGNAAAQYNMGSLYRRGHGVARDVETAISWFRRAAEQGEARAQFTLGNMYFHGKGVPQNSGKAAHWYRLAANQGFAGGQSNLGYMYRSGDGVPQNDETAVAWLRRAAEQGFADAQTKLGVMYGQGRGVRRNYILAHMWGSLAAANGSKRGRKLRDALAERLVPSQLEKSRTLARACLRRKYKGC